MSRIELHAYAQSRKKAAEGSHNAKSLYPELEDG